MKKYIALIGIVLVLAGNTLAGTTTAYRSGSTCTSGACYPGGNKPVLLAVWVIKGHSLSVWKVGDKIQYRWR